MFDKSVMPHTKEEVQDFLTLLIDEMSKQRIVCQSQARIAQELGDNIHAACVEYGISEAEVYGIKKGEGS